MGKFCAWFTLWLWSTLKRSRAYSSTQKIRQRPHPNQTTIWGAHVGRRNCSVWPWSHVCAVINIFEDLYSCSIRSRHWPHETNYIMILISMHGSGNHKVMWEEKRYHRQIINLHYIEPNDTVGNQQQPNLKTWTKQETKRTHMEYKNKIKMSMQCMQWNTCNDMLWCWHEWWNEMKQESAQCIETHVK